MKSNFFKNLQLIPSLFATLFLLPLSFSNAATLHVRPAATGSGSGADWNNALSANFSPARGNIYYIADGTYGSKVWSTGNSGTTPITIKKATIQDHGSALGWDNTLGDGQASWGSWLVQTDYWLFDGQVRNGDWTSGAVSQYGFKVVGGGRNGMAIRMDDGNGSAADFSTFRFVDAAGGGQGTGNGDDVIYGLYGNKNITFQSCALRDSDRTIFLQRGCWQNLIVENSYIARNNSTPAIHGEINSDTCSDGQIFRFNVIEDGEGTAIWALINGGGAKSPDNTATGWKIYGNIIRSTAQGEDAAGIIYVANDASNKNWMDDLTYVNNTHVNAKNAFYIIFIETAGTGNKVQNNIFYSCKAGGYNNPGLISHNWYYNTPNTSDSGANKIVSTTGASNFLDVAHSDMRLTASIPGTALDTSLNQDFEGNIRTDANWDRGAFEFQDGSVRPASPTNLRVTE